MKINTKIHYGLRAIIEIANHDGATGILQKDIAKNQDLSLKYLDPIILALKLKGLVANSKGKGSGYKLTRPANEITIFDIYTAFESITFLDCINNKDYCDRSSNCKSRGLFCDIKRETEEVLKRRKLSELL